MKAASKSLSTAFTLLEVLVVIVVVGFLFLLMFPHHNGYNKARQVACLGNLRQLANGLNMFATDHSTNFPWPVSATNGGSLESISQGGPAPHFQTLSKYLNDNWRVLSCPADISRRPAADPLSTLNASNISYFCNLDAVPFNQNSVLVGDRNLQITGFLAKPGLIAVSSNTPVAWTREGHGRIMRIPCGSLAFGDGHVEVSRTNLPALIQRQGLATNRLAIP